MLHAQCVVRDRVSIQSLRRAALLRQGRVESNDNSESLRLASWSFGSRRGVYNRGERCGESGLSPLQFLVLRKGAVSLEKIKDMLCG